MRRLIPMRTAVRSLAWCLALFAPAPLAAQSHPIAARGTGSASAFASDGIDTVNLFNRNLTMAIPLGQRYPLGPGLSYGFTAHYNSNVWDAEEAFNCSDEKLPCARMEPGADFNAGLGWTLSLGRLLPPDPSEDRERWTYVAPDSSRHVFYDTLHVGEPSNGPCMPELGCRWQYSRDGSYLRLDRDNLKVEFPDGSTHTFGGPAGELTDLRDRFGNWLAISVGANAWNLTDRHGRSHSVDFTTVAGVKVVQSVTLAAFGGGSATYAFSYQPWEISRPYMDTDDDSGDSVTVPLLYDVTGTATAAPAMTYSMWQGGAPAYYFGGRRGSLEPSGQLRRIVLPTRGTMEWTYSPISYPVAGNFRHLENGFGVATKVTGDPWGTGGTWTYATVLHPEGGLPTEVQTVVVNPAGTRGVHYFGVPRLLSTVTWTGWEYGLPFTSRVASGGRYLSNETYAANGTLLRREWLAFTHDVLPTPAEAAAWYDSNRRVVSASTTFVDDGNRVASRAQSDFDGLGHFRVSTASDNFDGTTTRTETTKFNPSRGCYDVNLATNTQNCNGANAFVPPVPSDPWVLGTFTYREQLEGGVTARQEFAFQGNGFLDCRRTLRVGTSRGAADVVSTYAHPGTGFPTVEKLWGGDDQNVGTASTCATASAPAYWVEHTYAAGVRATSRLKNSGGGWMNFYSLNRSIDVATGLPGDSWDESGFRTQLSYDGFGRPTRIDPRGNDGAEKAARVDYTYTAAGSAPAKVIRKLCFASGTGSCTQFFGESETHLDGFGRPFKERTRRADGGWSRQETSYNALGWRTGFSETGPDSGTLPWNTLDQFDAFGRPGRLQKADSKLVNFTYAGRRESTRRTRVYTTIGSAEASAYTTEVYDSFGRLRKVFEPAMPDGSNVNTTYAYDVGHRLAHVRQVAGAATQNRYFSYDNRGFLLSEQHPEKGAAGNGTVTYHSHDALGLASEVRDGSASNSLVASFDPAGRLLTVSEGGAGGRLLKELVYGSSGSGLAKVVTANRHNYLPEPLSTDYLVTETYTYGGVGRRPSSRTTQTRYFGADKARFVQSWTYDRGGNPTSRDYPRCYDGGCPATGTPQRIVTNTWSNGWLTAVPGWANVISYHTNGLLNAVGFANNVSQLVYNDPNGIQRPQNIEYIRTSDGHLFGDLGPFEYDGSGNLKRLDLIEHTYDLASRVRTCGVWVTGVGRLCSATYDGFGNVTSLTQNGVSRNTPTSSGTNRLSGASYDPGGAGNVVAWNGASYTYDRLNMMTRVTNGGEDWVYAYTADDERILEYRMAGGAWRTALRDLDGKVLREFWVDQGWVSEDFVYRGSTLLASVHPTEGTRFFGPDHLGTPRGVFTSAGTLIGLHTYFPYGEEATASTQDTQQTKFTGHERDLLSTPTAPADDLDYMHARHYSPLTARFLSVDPMPGLKTLPKSWNRYAYVLGNPLEYTDPTGMIFGMNPGGLQALLMVVSFSDSFPVATFSDSTEVVATGVSVSSQSTTLRFLHDTPVGPSMQVCDIGCELGRGVVGKTSWLVEGLESIAIKLDEAFPLVSATDAALHGDYWTALKKLAQAGGVQRLTGRLIVGQLTKSAKGPGSLFGTL